MNKNSEDIRRTKMDGLIHVIEYYLDINSSSLSDEQIGQLKDARDAIVSFGKYGLGWAMMANDMLKKNGLDDGFDILYKKDFDDVKEHKSVNMHKIIRESINHVLREDRNPFQDAIDAQMAKIKKNRPEIEVADDFWDCDDDTYTFEPVPGTTHGVHVSRVMKDGVIYGTLCEYEYNFIMPITCAIYTPDVEKIMKGEDGDEEYRLCGVWATDIGFNRYSKFIEYLNKHQKEWAVILKYQKEHPEDY